MATFSKLSVTKDRYGNLWIDGHKFVSDFEASLYLRANCGIPEKEAIEMVAFAEPA